MLTMGAAQAQEVKVGFVSTERIFREAAPAKTANAKIEQEFSKRDKELQDMGARLKGMADKLDKDAPVLAEAIAAVDSASSPTLTRTSSAASASSAKT